MKTISIFLSVCTILFARVKADNSEGPKVDNLEGPFALYTKSDDPNFDSRVINIGQRDGWFTITSAHQNISDIAPYNTNFYLDSTFQPGSPSGWLVWGAVSPYYNLYNTISLIDPTTNIAPFFFDFNMPSAFDPATAYTRAFNFTSDGELQFENISNRFFAKLLEMPFYTADAVFWLFGEGPAPEGYSSITLWRYQPSLTPTSLD